jgi:hypothetical protein
MHKLFWCCTAAGVLAAGGVYTAVRHGCGCETVLTHSAAAATAATRMMHPLVGLGVAAGRCLRGHGTEETLTQAAPDEGAAPDEPVPAPIVIPEEEPAAAGHLRIPEVEISDQLGKGETAPEGGVCVPGNSYQAGGIELAAPPTGAPPCPMVMPHCTDEEAPACLVPPMPYADEEPAVGGNPLSNFWMGLFGQAKEDGGIEETAEPARIDDAPNCQEDAHYYDHYSGCPYTGYHLPSHRCPVTPIEAEPARRPGQDECSEEPASKKHKVHHSGPGAENEECPRHPDVDTMEYRRSDGGLNEYGPGPF